MTPKKFLAYAIGPIGGAALSLITLPILAWMYSPDDIGRYAIIHVAVSLSFLLCSLGLEQAYVREFYEHNDNAGLLKTTFSVGLLMTSLLLIGLIASGSYVSKSLFDIDSNVLSILLAICVASNFIKSYSLLTLRMTEKALSYSLINLSNSAVFLLAIILIYFSESEKTFTVLLFAHTFSFFIASLFSLLMCKNEWIKAYHARFIVEDISKLLQFSIPLILGGISYWGLSSLDRVGLRGLSTLDQLGIFSIAASFAGAATIVSRIFSTIWTPFVFKWSKEGIDIDEFNNICEKVVLLVVGVYVTAGTFSWVVRLILPQTYYDAVHIITACMGAPLLYILSETTVVGTHLARKSSYSMLASFFGLMTAAALIYVMVPRLGAAGAASATCIAFFVFLLLRTEFSVMLWGKIPRKKLYGFSLTCVVLSVTQALFYELFGNYFFGVWGLMYISVIAFFREQIIELLSIIWKGHKREIKP